MRAEKGCDLGLDRLRQHRSRSRHRRACVRCGLLLGGC
jgi:hypothetical protein